MAFSTTDWRNRVGNTSGSSISTPYNFSTLEQVKRQGKYYWGNTYDGTYYSVTYEGCGGGYQPKIVEGLYISATNEIRGNYSTYYVTEFGYNYSQAYTNYFVTNNSANFYQPQSYYSLAVSYYTNYINDYTQFNYFFPYNFFSSSTFYYVGVAYISSPYIHGFYWYGYAGTYSNVQLQGNGNYQYQQTYLNGWCS